MGLEAVSVVIQTKIEKVGEVINGAFKIVGATEIFGAVKIAGITNVGGKNGIFV